MALFQFEEVLVRVTMQELYKSLKHQIQELECAAF